jgi:hypothetical protein
MGREKVFQFALGVKARDEVTGFEGVITGRYEFLNGCKRYSLEALKDDDVKEFTFDEDRLRLVKAEPSQVQPSGTGGPRRSPPRTGAR